LVVLKLFWMLFAATRETVFLDSNKIDEFLWHFSEIKELSWGFCQMTEENVQNTFKNFIGVLNSQIIDKILETSSSHFPSYIHHFIHSLILKTWMYSCWNWMPMKVLNVKKLEPFWMKFHDGKNNLAGWRKKKCSCQRPQTSRQD